MRVVLVSARGNNAGDKMDYVLTVAGGLVLGFAGWLSLRPVSLSMGHALICAIGAALIALPQLTNFEYADGAVKFTTRAQSAELTEEVKRVVAQQSELASSIATLSNALKDMASDISELRSAVQQVKPEAKFELKGEYKPEFWQGLATKGGELKTQSDRTYENLNTLQKTFQGLSQPLTTPYMQGN